MKELDLLKKDWKKNENSFEQISVEEIYKIIHKKSSSVVKWILIISILEVTFWTLSGLLFDIDDYLKHLNHPEISTYLKILDYFNYIIIVVFIYFFYKNYKQISTTESTKLLMISILKIRKTVQFYIWYNLAMIVLSSIIGFFIVFLYNPDMINFKENLATNGKIMTLTIGIALLIIFGFLGIFWLIYRLIYGTLLKRLNINYKELKKIDF